MCGMSVRDYYTSAAMPLAKGSKKVNARSSSTPDDKGQHNGGIRKSEGCKVTIHCGIFSSPVEKGWGIFTASQQQRA